ncbi:Os04g0331501 [Oryza sativa Japonica Group]|uniref:Os04g0331501 protein n=2 Tax=Oryza sativa subsp. japonica TaxID=39947 RepID=A0A0P0W8U5_ORYSJ|nr:hypothetical protein OsJ_14307 [Oryza sativa Japonica Group]BAS88621.1 Os04g0331501 [Oryza sativa Japonica Group]CAE05793.1 OSJNBb0046K02.3 [Oryza sativa Japonica Group]
MVVRVTTGSTWTRRGQWLEEDSGDVIRVDGAGAFRWSSLDKNARLRKRMTRESKADIEGRQVNAAGRCSGKAGGTAKGGRRRRSSLITSKEELPAISRQNGGVAGL